MSHTINKENAVKECSRALCNDAQETLRTESNAAARDTYVACGCNTLARDLTKVAVVGGSLAGAFLLAKRIWDGGISEGELEILTKGKLKEAMALFTDGKYAEAADVYTEALDVAIGLKNNDLIEAASHGVMACYNSLKDHGALRGVYEKLAKYYAGQKEFDAAAEVMEKIADTYREQQNHRGALEALEQKAEYAAKVTHEPAWKLVTLVRALDDQAEIHEKLKEKDLAAEKYLASAELLVQGGDLDGAIKRYDSAIKIKRSAAAMNHMAKISSLNNELKDLDKLISSAKTKKDFSGMRTALEEKIDIYRDLQCTLGRMEALTQIAWTYEQQKDWRKYIYVCTRIDELVERVEDKVERARQKVGLWGGIADALDKLGEKGKAKEARTEAKKYRKIVEAAKKAAKRSGSGPVVVHVDQNPHVYDVPAETAAVKEEASPAPVKVERPDIEKEKAAKIGSQVLETLKSWHEIAENMTDGGSPEQLDAASRRFEMSAHVMQAFGYVHGAREAYERAANAILAKAPLDTAELERMAGLYEDATCDPEYADANFSKAGKYWFDAAQAWAKTGNIAQALADLDRAKKAYDASNGPVEKETVLKMGVLKASLIRRLSEKAPDVREHYQVRLPASVIAEYLKGVYGAEWDGLEFEQRVVLMNNLGDAVTFALKHHRGELEPFINEGKISVEACTLAMELWKKSDARRGAPSKGPAVAAGVEGVARAARSEGAERREELEKRGKGPEKKDGREEGRKGPGPEVKGRP